MSPSQWAISGRSAASALCRFVPFGSHHPAAQTSSGASAETALNPPGSCNGTVTTRQRAPSHRSTRGCVKTVCSIGPLDEPTAHASSGPSAATDERLDTGATAGSLTDRHRRPSQCHATPPTTHASSAEDAEMSESSGTE